MMLKVRTVGVWTQSETAQHIYTDEAIGTDGSPNLLFCVINQERMKYEMKKNKLNSLKLTKS